MPKTRVVTVEVADVDAELDAVDVADELPLVVTVVPTVEDTVLDTVEVAVVVSDVAMVVLAVDEAVVLTVLERVVMAVLLAVVMAVLLAVVSIEVDAVLETDELAVELPVLVTVVDGVVISQFEKTSSTHRPIKSFSVSLAISQLSLSRM